MNFFFFLKNRIKFELELKRIYSIFCAFIIIIIIINIIEKSDGEILKIISYGTRKPTV